MTNDEKAILKAFCLAVIAVEGVQGGVDPKIEKLAEEAGRLISFGSSGPASPPSLKPLFVMGDEKTTKS